MAKQIKIIYLKLLNEKFIQESESLLEQFVNDEWVIVGQCTCGNIPCIFVTLQKE